MTEASWIGQVTAVGSALAGVVISQFLSNKFRVQDRQWRLTDEARLRLIARGEELYSLVSHWNNISSTHLIYYPKAMRGIISYNDALDAVIQSGSIQRNDFERIDLLIDVYFPVLKNHIVALRQLVHDANSIEADFRSLHKQGLDVSEQHASDYTGKLMAADTSARALMSRLALLLSTVAAADEKPSEATPPPPARPRSP